MAESYVGVKCHRSGKSVYAADRPVTVDGPDGERWTFLPQNFTCAQTGTKLTLKTYVVYDKEVYIKDYSIKSGKQPDAGASAVADQITDRVMAVPDSNMRSSDRMLNIAGKQAAKACTTEDPGSTYGSGAKDVVRQMTVPDANMRTSDRVFQTTGNQAARGFTTANGAGSAYGGDALEVKTKIGVVKPPVTVNNIDLKEMRHNGTDAYTGVKEE